MINTVRNNLLVRKHKVDKQLFSYIENDGSTNIGTVRNNRIVDVHKVGIC